MFSALLLIPFAQRPLRCRTLTLESWCNKHLTCTFKLGAHRPYKELTWRLHLRYSTPLSAEHFSKCWTETISPPRESPTVSQDTKKEIVCLNRSCFPFLGCFLCWRTFLGWKGQHIAVVFVFVQRALYKTQRPSDWATNWGKESLKQSSKYL